MNQQRATTALEAGDREREYLIGSVALWALWGMFTVLAVVFPAAYHESDTTLQVWMFIAGAFVSAVAAVFATGIWKAAALHHERLLLGLIDEAVEGKE